MYFQILSPPQVPVLISKWPPCQCHLCQTTFVFDFNFFEISCLLHSSSKAPSLPSSIPLSPYPQFKHQSFVSISYIQARCLPPASSPDCLKICIIFKVTVILILSLPPNQPTFIVFDLPLFPLWCPLFPLLILRHRVEWLGRSLALWYLQQIIITLHLFALKK